MVAIRTASRHRRFPTPAGIPDGNTGNTVARCRRFSVNESYVDSFATPWDPQFVAISGGTPTTGPGPYFDDVLVATDNVVPAVAGTWGRIKSAYRR